MILTPQDKDVYFPSVCLEGANLLGAIRLTESIAQSPEGSNRQLEITTYSEEKGLNAFDRSLRLSYYPVISGSLTVVAQRVAGIDGFGRRVYGFSSRTLSPSEYTLDGETVYINVDDYVRRIKVTYQAGFDFNVDTPDTIAIKSALGALLNYRQSFVGQGLTRVDALGMNLNAPKPGVMPDDLMCVFRQYRPRN